MHDYRSRSRRVLSFLSRTPADAAANLQGDGVCGTLMQKTSPAGCFLLLSLQGLTSGAYTLFYGRDQIPLPPATARGALWCALLTQTVSGGTVSVADAEGRIVVSGLLQTDESAPPAK
ncbi:MAG: hypothetical protein IK080_06380 [Clostridia bacterium]|nr:hypothetical protein [Clostridia bacterium]